MWKKSLLALLMVSPFVFAEAAKKTQPKTYSEAEVAQIKSQIENKIKEEWKAVQQKEVELARQREYFLQAEALLKNAQAKGQLSNEALQLSGKLIGLLANYPLAMEIEWELLKTKLALKQATEVEIAAFSQKYPNSPYQKNLSQLPFEQLYHQQKLAELLDYARTTAPVGNENQCRVFSAQYQLLAAQIQSNPEAEQVQAPQQPENAPETQAVNPMQDLLEQFDKFWLKTAELPQMCGDIEGYWRDQGGKSVEKVQLKAVELFKQNAAKGLDNLIANNQDGESAKWLAEVKKLLTDPVYLQTFMQNQPFTEANKALVTSAFPRFVRALPENMPNPDFATYHIGAEKWRFTSEEMRERQIVFLNRLFDNESGGFKNWRDKTLSELKADLLTERRLRMALWKNEDLTPWLGLLSKTASEKAEWRYWAAKNEKEPTKRNQLFEQLTKERGFFPMLAAQQLGKSYSLASLEVKPLTEAQKVQFKQPLDRIVELRALNRLNQAKAVWAEWLKPLNFEEQIALSDYALTQNWSDLAVEASIQAKAWDYLQLRLPDAYSHWFDVNLTEKGVSKTFAMAIARQESAWSPHAKSHANAMGLMQMLPSTASRTAQNFGLPFGAENDLFEPAKNIMLGVAHLNELNAKYPNNRILMAAAYNAGMHRVERWLARSQGKITMDAFISSIPFYETRGYVQNVLAYDYYYQILQQKADNILFYKEEAERKY